MYHSSVSILQFLTFFALAAWLGSLIFFPVVASVAFAVLPTAHLAGMVVRNSLDALHWIGLVAGLVFLISSLFYDRVVEGGFRPFRASHIAILVMLSLTAVSEFRIIPRMDALRAAAGEIASLAPNSPVRVEFESLHARSVHLEGTILLLAVLVLFLTSRRFASVTA